MNRTYTKGLTLIEFLLVIAIVSVIVIVAPNPTRLIGRQQLHASQSELRLMVTRARSDAFTLNVRITVCPLSAENRCLYDWSGVLTEFTDVDGNRALDPGDKLISRIEIPANIQLDWKGMNPANSLHFSPKGITFVSNGTFTICKKDLPETIKLIINRQGRIRAERILQSCTELATI